VRHRLASQRPADERPRVWRGGPLSPYRQCQRVSAYDSLGAYRQIAATGHGESTCPADAWREMHNKLDKLSVSSEDDEQTASDFTA
jgi:hypothetical protein